MTTLSLCTGYGGLDLLVEHTLDETTDYVAEIDPHACQVIAARFPAAHNLGDLKTIEWGLLRGIDTITAGYPCQPFSQAGRRQGTDDTRHLWPWIIQAIRVVRPRRVVLENVRGHLTKGFGTVIGDLADAGYDARWACVRAAEIGAPHRRDRVFIVAAAPDTLCTGTRRDARGLPRPAGETGRPDINVRAARDAHGTCCGSHWGPYEAAVTRWASILDRCAPAPTGPRFVEWMMGLPDGWVTDIIDKRTNALRILGNGVVPQQAAHALRVLTGGAIEA